MRQGQQNRRSRGRGRKQQNPLSRNYESNGPDVKIRGTASHVAEKYASLARDALAAGDMVTAENYFQHAEHYMRIILAAQAQSSQSSNSQPRDGENAPVANGESRSDGDEAVVDVGASEDALPSGGDQDAAASSNDGSNGRRGGRRRSNGNGRSRSGNGDGRRNTKRAETADEVPAAGEFAGLPPSVASGPSRPKGPASHDGSEDHEGSSDAISDDGAIAS